MQTFRDNQQRSWTVLVDTGAIKAVRAKLDVDLADTSGRSIDAISEDPVLLVDVLWVLCESQARAAGVTDKEFGRSLVGDPIDEAATALLEAVVHFFPSRKRLMLAKILARLKATRDRAEAKIRARIDDPQIEAALEAAIDTEVDRAVEEALTRLRSRTASPGSAASSPTG